ncbi:MAG: hypothetical protein J5849_04880, partial [Clostridia bacterium]|nr:hypothetical protein [Clostridia bacterium]
SFTLNKSFGFGWISSDALAVGESYTVEKDGGEVLSWTQSDTITGSAGMGGFGGGGFPGGQGFLGGQGGPGGQGGGDRGRGRP